MLAARRARQQVSLLQAQQESKENLSCWMQWTSHRFMFQLQVNSFFHAIRISILRRTHLLSITRILRWLLSIQEGDAGVWVIHFLLKDQKKILWQSEEESILEVASLELCRSLSERNCDYFDFRQFEIEEQFHWLTWRHPYGKDLLGERPRFPSLRRRAVSILRTNNIRLIIFVVEQKEWLINQDIIWKMNAWIG